MLLGALAEILVCELAELDVVEMHDYTFKSVAFKSELLAQSAQIHVDPALDLHIEEVFLSEDGLLLQPLL